MSQQSVRYAITDLCTEHKERSENSVAARREQWRSDLRRWAAQSIDFIQLRESSLTAGELVALTQSAMTLLGSAGSDAGITRRRPRLLVNSRADVAAAAGADGCHLTSRPGELRPAQVRAVFSAAGLASCTVSLSCHTLDEVSAARDEGVDLILFGPVFGKTVDEREVVPGVGLAALRAACVAAGEVPVLALGGVTEQTVPLCSDAGAAGVAAIRMFAAKP